VKYNFRKPLPKNKWFFVVKRHVVIRIINLQSVGLRACFCWLVVVCACATVARALHKLALLRPTCFLTRRGRTCVFCSDGSWDPCAKWQFLGERTRPPACPKTLPLAVQKNDWTASGTVWVVDSVGLEKACLRWGHIFATCRIRLNRPCAAAVRPYVTLLWPLVIIGPHRSITYVWMWLAIVSESATVCVFCSATTCQWRKRHGRRFHGRVLDDELCESSLRQSAADSSADRRSTSSRCSVCLDPRRFDSFRRQSEGRSDRSIYTARRHRLGQIGVYVRYLYRVAKMGPRFDCRLLIFTRWRHFMLRISFLK